MNTNRLSILGGSIAIILIVVLGYMLGISPKMAEADAIVAQQQTADSDNVTQQAALDVLRQKYSKIADLRTEYSALQTAIPLTANTPDFVDQVKSLADANGVTILALTLAEPAAVVAPASSSAATSTASPQPSTSAAPASTPVVTSSAAAGQALAGRLFFSAVHITVLGSSDQVFGFVSALQQGQRLFLSDQVAVTAAGAAPGGTVSGYILIVPPVSSTKAVAK